MAAGPAPTAEKDVLGLRGERIAERYLRSLGWRIEARRWRMGNGDIDLVAEDRGEVVFVEVKTRRGAAYGAPEESVTARKRRQLAALAHAYMEERGDARPYRIDVIGIRIGSGAPRLRHFRHAVSEGD